MKKTTRKVLLGAATLSAVMASADMAEAAKANLAVTAKIIQAITVAQTAALDFGTLSSTAAGGTLKLEHDGTVTPTGGVTAIGGEAVGGIKVGAATALPIDINFVKTATLISGANNIKVDQFTILGSKATPTNKYVTTLTASPKTALKVGATLQVGAAQATGTYTGTAQVTANYQ